MNYSNRRNYTRYAFTVAVTLFQNELMYRCNECSNISRGGMCVVLRNTTFIQGRVTVTLSKIYDSTLVDFQAECKVAWQDMNGGYNNSRMLGLEFISMDYHNSEALEKILSFSSSASEAVF